VYPTTDIDPFRSVPTRSGTNSRRFRRGAIRREWHALSKDRNAAMASWGRSLRASQEAVIRCVMPLGKGVAIPCEASLA